MKCWCLLMNNKIKINVSGTDVLVDANSIVNNIKNELTFKEQSIVERTIGELVDRGYTELQAYKMAFYSTFSKNKGE